MGKIIPQIGKLFGSFRHAGNREIEQAGQDVQVTLSGKIRIFAPVFLERRHIAPGLAPFLKANPDVSVDLLLSDRLVDLVVEGFDLAIRVAKPADSSLIARRHEWPFANLDVLGWCCCAAPLDKTPTRAICCFFVGRVLILFISKKITGHRMFVQSPVSNSFQK